MRPCKRGTGAVVGSCLAIFWPGAFIFGYPGVMGSYWQELFNVGRGGIGGTLFFVLSAVGIFMFLAGRLQERLGVRKMITAGAIICGLDVFLIAAPPNIFVLYLWAFIMGAGSSFIYMPMLTSVQQWFPTKRGLVSGIVNMMFGMSAALMAPIFSLMFRELGYFTMNIVLGIVALIVGVIAAQFTEKPETPIQPATVPGRAKGDRIVPERSFTVAESINSKGFWFLWATWALQGAASIAMVTLSVQYGLSRGFTLPAAVLVLTAFNFTNGFSRLVMGFLSDRIGRRLAMSSTFIGAAVGYFLLPLVEGPILTAVLAALIGWGFGTLFAVSAPLAVDCFGLRHFGAIFGLVFTAYGFVSGWLGPWLGGHIVDATGGNFIPVFIYLGLFSASAGILIWFVRPPARIGEDP